MTDEEKAKELLQQAHLRLVQAQRCLTATEHAATYECLSISERYLITAKTLLKM